MGSAAPDRLPNVLVLAAIGERYTIGRELIDCGFNVLEAAESQEAIERFGQERIDVLLINRAAASDSTKYLRRWVAENRPSCLTFIASDDDEAAATVDLLCENETFLAGPYDPRLVAARIAREVRRQTGTSRPH